MNHETGFRDLFAELPAALFEALRGIGEQAVRQAQRPAARPRSRISDLDALRSHEAAIMGVFGWTEMQSVRSQVERALLVSAMLPCGHRVRYRLCEQAVAASDISRVLIGAVYAKPQSCYCVQRPRGES